MDAMHREVARQRNARARDRGRLRRGRPRLGGRPRRVGRLERARSARRGRGGHRRRAPRPPDADQHRPRRGHQRRRRRLRRVVEALGTQRCRPVGYNLACHVPEVRAEFHEPWLRVHTRDVTPVDGVRFYSNGLSGAYEVSTAGVCRGDHLAGGEHGRLPGDDPGRVRRRRPRVRRARSVRRMHQLHPRDPRRPRRARRATRPARPQHRTDLRRVRRARRGGRRGRPRGAHRPAESACPGAGRPRRSGHVVSCSSRTAPAPTANARRASQSMPPAPALPPVLDSVPPPSGTVPSRVARHGGNAAAVVATIEPMRAIPDLRRTPTFRRRGEFDAGCRCGAARPDHLDDRAPSTRSSPSSR